MSIARQNAGFSLIEIVVAVLVLSVAVIGLFRVFDTNTQNAAGQRDRALAMIVAQNRAQSIALGVRDLPASVRLGRKDWVVQTSSKATLGGFVEIDIHVSPSSGGSGVLLTTYARDQEE